MVRSPWIPPLLLAPSLHLNTPPPIAPFKSKPSPQKKAPTGLNAELAEELSYVNQSRWATCGWISSPSPCHKIFIIFPQDTVNVRAEGFTFRQHSQRYPIQPGPETCKFSKTEKVFYLPAVHAILVSLNTHQPRHLPLANKWMLLSTSRANTRAGLKLVHHHYSSVFSGCLNLLPDTMKILLVSLHDSIFWHFQESISCRHLSVLA